MKDSLLVLWLVTVLFMIALQGEMDGLNDRVDALEKRVRHLEEIADVQAQP